MSSFPSCVSAAPFFTNTSDNEHIHLSLAEFSSFVASSPSIIPVVRSLRFEIMGAVCHGYDTRELNPLAHLKSVSVKGSLFDPGLSLPHAEPWKRQITSLSLESQGFADFYKFVAFIVRFTLLERLAMNNMLWFYQPIPDLRQRLPSTLHTLDLQWCNVSHLFEWILSHDPMPSLHTIVLTYQNPKELSVINKMCSALRSSLRHFELITYTHGLVGPCTLWYIFALTSG
jgi:hypothetical protein